MNDKTNFYVFEKKEILLITILVLLVAVTSFLFGLKIGSSYSFDSAGINQETKEILDTPSTTVDLTSSEEEKVANIVSEQGAKNKDKDLNKEIESSLKKKMLEEFSNENKKFNKDTLPTESSDTQQQKKNEESQVAAPKVNSRTFTDNEDTAMSEDKLDTKSSDAFSGKYTIQLASYKSITDAKEFAEGFKVLGFNPIINEAEPPGKGTYFRVSLGVFDSIAQAKEFVLKNKSVFAERDYVFLQFD